MRLFFEILDFVEEFDKPAVLFFYDFEKAFDSLNHDFLFKALEFFNFGESLIK